MIVHGLHAWLCFVCILGGAIANPGSGYSSSTDINGNSVCVRSGCPAGYIGYNCECKSTGGIASCTSCAAGFGMAGTQGPCSLTNAAAYYAAAFGGPAPASPTAPAGGGDDDTDDDDNDNAAALAELAELFVWLSVVILFFVLLGVEGLLHQCKTGQGDNSGGRRELEGWWQAYLLIAFGAMDQLCGVLYAAHGAPAVGGSAYYINDEPQDAALAFAVLLNAVPACWFLGAGYGLADFKFADVRWQWSQRIFWSWMLVDDNLTFRGPEWASMIYVGLCGIPIIVNVVIASFAAATIWLIIPLEIIFLVLEQGLSNGAVRITTLWGYFSAVWIPALSCGEPKGKFFVLAGPGWLIILITMLVCSILGMVFSVTLVFVLPSLYACFTMLRIPVLWPNGWQSFESAAKSVTGTMRIMSKTGGTIQPQDLDEKEHAQIIGDLIRPVTAARKKAGGGNAWVAVDQCFVLGVTVIYQLVFHTFPLLIIAGSGAMSDLAITTVVFNSCFIALALFRFTKGGMWLESNLLLFDKLANIELFVDQSGGLSSVGGGRRSDPDASDFTPSGEVGLPPRNPNAGWGHGGSDAALPALPDASWNCMSMQKDESMLRIQGQPAGSFVIRKSEKSFAALSMMNKGNKVYHQHIEHTSQGQYKLKSSKSTHPTLEAMIRHYSNPQHPVTGNVFLIGASGINTSTNQKIQALASISSSASFRSRGGSVSSVGGGGGDGYITTYPGDETSADFGFDQSGLPNPPPPNFGGGGGGGHRSAYLAPAAYGDDNYEAVNDSPAEDGDDYYEAIDDSLRSGNHGGGGTGQSIRRETSDDFGGFGGTGQSIRRETSDDFGGFGDTGDTNHSTRGNVDMYGDLGGMSDDFQSPPRPPARKSTTAKPGLAGFMSNDDFGNEDFGGFGDDLANFQGYNEVEPLED